MEGLLTHLMGNSEEAHYLRDRIIFKIIPMLNPDGVVMGNYRTGFGGRDLNRRFRTFGNILFPPVTGL